MWPDRTKVMSGCCNALPIGLSVLICVGGCGGKGPLKAGTGPDTGTSTTTPGDAAYEGPHPAAEVLARDVVRGDAPVVEDVPEDVPVGTTGDAAPIDVRPAPPEVGAPTSDTGLMDAKPTPPEAGAPDTIAPDDVPACAMYPSTSRVDADGKVLFWYRFDWQQPDLASVCASFGADATMVIEHRLGGPATPSDLPACSTAEVMGYGDHACAMAGLVRLQADCTAGYILFEATQAWDIVHWRRPGYFHIESAKYPALARRVIVQDNTCSRALHPRFVPLAPAASPEVGIDTGDGPPDDWYDPAANGQPCHVSNDCPPQRACFIDAPVGDCQSGPVGHCVPPVSSNACALNHTCGWCLVLFGTTCSGFPGNACGFANGCAACVPSADGGIDSL